jgi:predicted RNA-binding protein YlqC (UPF0109 family)
VKDLVEFMARSIVEEPDAVEVSEEPGEEGRVIIRLQVAEDDKGKIIGRHGRVAEAMRTLLRVAAIKGGTRASLEIP